MISDQMIRTETYNLQSIRVQYLQYYEQNYK